MKKKSKAGVVERQSPKPRPPKIGGRSEVSAKVNWSKVGRRRLEENNGIERLASALRTAREEKGISITKLATDLGVAPATLIKFENRSYPVSIKVVLAMAHKLGCTLEVKAQS